MPDPTRPQSGLAALGPYFAIETHGLSSPVTTPWVPLKDLATSPGTMRARIQEVREALAAAAGRPPGAIEFRVAASVAQLGLAARMLSPVIGAAALGERLLFDIDQARWIPSLGGPFRLSLPATAQAVQRRNAEPGLDCHQARELLAGPIRSLVRTTASMAVSEYLLWGNVSSAINGAAATIAGTRPDLAGRAIRAAAVLLDFPALARSYRGQPVRSYQRRSCCLIYRIAGPAAATYCGDCILTAAAKPSGRFDPT